MRWVKPRWFYLGPDFIKVKDIVNFDQSLFPSLIETYFVALEVILIKMETHANAVAHS